MFKIHNLLILIALIIVSCDVPGKIELTNNLNKIAIISFSYKDIDGDYLSKINKINPNEKRYIILGFGTKWNQKSINNFSNRVIDTINLKVGDSEYYCSSKQCKEIIINMLNRKSNNTMQIIIDSILIREAFLIK